MDPRLAFALDAAEEAGRSTLPHFHNAVGFTRKSDRTPVTIADVEAETMIRRRIAERFPDDGILGEEEGEIGDQSRRWIIDPIDGTKSFICGVPLYATLLAFEVDAEPQLGVCVFPALGLSLYAQRGHGAFLNGQPIRVSTTDSLDDAVISCAGHKGMERYGRMAGLQALAERAIGTRTWCDAYGHALVAMGRIEAMIDPVVSRWDLSAMCVIVQEAGGTFTNFAGEPGVYEEAVSTNGVLTAEILAAFA